MSRWGDEKTKRFIRLYRQRECLWNTRLMLYKNNTAREQAYRSILKEFNDANLDIKSVRTKIKNLRSVYHSELRKMKNAASCGSEGVVYKPSLIWFDDMHAFLGEYCFEERTEASDSINIEMPAQETEYNSEQPEQHIKTENEQIFVTCLEEPPEEAQGSCYHSNSSHNKPSCAPSSGSEPTSPIPSLKRKRSYESQYKTLVQRLEDAISNVASTKQGQPIIQDEFYFFALSVAAQLRQLPLHVAITTEGKIQNIITEARLAALIPNNPNTSQYASVKIENDSEF